MKITLSKSQWQFIGKKAGWMKIATDPKLKLLKLINKGGYNVCQDCGGLVHTNYEWLGENKDGVGKTRHINQCEGCGRWSDEIISGG